MAHIRQIDLINIMDQLPHIEPLDTSSLCPTGRADLFVCALGFEDRTLSIPEYIAGRSGVECGEAIHFEYATNANDNEVNKPKLTKYLQGFAKSVGTMPCDVHDFSIALRKSMEIVCEDGRVPHVIFDISVCSSRVLLLVLKVLLEFNLNLSIVYSEAEVYHPTKEEYERNPGEWTTEEGFGIARGVGTLIASPEHPGYRRDRLPEVMAVFPTFKPERAKAVIADIDESLLMGSRDRVIWVVGDPHLTADHWRADAIREINKISPQAQSHEVSTFDYLKTIDVLERIYKPRDCKYHINVAPFGSKMQSVGIALFWYLHQDVSVVFATPKEYNARQYSEGCKGMGQINFGSLASTRAILDSVGQLLIVD